MWKGFLPADDIRFFYSLSGGALMDFGTYNVSCLRQMLDDARPEVTSTTFRPFPKQDIRRDGQVEEQIDEAVTATYKSKAGADGLIVADFAMTGGYPLFPSAWTTNWPSVTWPKCVVELGEKELESSSQPDGEVHTVTRKVTLWNHIMPTIYHTINVQDQHAIRRGSQEVRSWTETKTIKAYDWPDKTDSRAGADWWSTYRHQLEEFVNHVQGRKGSGVWIDGEDSIAQMDVIDRTYEKGGLKIRPSSSFTLDG
jgi:predicted dehydrogenase